MFLRLFLLVCLIPLMAGCQHSSQKLVSAVYHSGPQHREVGDFNRVCVDGRMDVNLRTGFSHSRLILKGDPRDLLLVKTKVMNGTLHVTLGSDYPKFGKVQVEIDSHYLNSFEYHGMGLITGTNLHTRLLDVSINNIGNTSLSGQMGLRKLSIAGKGYTEISGISSPDLFLKLSGSSKLKLVGTANLRVLDVNNNSWLSMYWIKSRALTVRVHGKGAIQLAGAVEHLDVELWDSAHFRGRYLRTERAFIKTHDRSVAEMSAATRQHTLATGSSDIRFYHIPVMKADFMDDNGAVLDMRDLSSPFVQEYNQYNK